MADVSASRNQTWLSGYKVVAPPRMTRNSRTIAPATKMRAMSARIGPAVESN